MKKGKAVISLIFSLLSCLQILGQSVDDALQTVVEQEKWDVMAVPEEVDLTVYQDFEQDLLENPVNLGEINPLELLRLGLLDKSETDALYQYLLDYGPMVTVYELQMVEGIPQEKIMELARFVCVNHDQSPLPTLTSLLRAPRVECLLSSKRVLQTRAGYLKDTTVSSLMNQYQGTPWQQKANVRISLGRNIVAGFSAKNDPGEADWAKSKRLTFDDQSSYLGISNLGCVKKIIAGRYGLSFGQGLVLGGGSSMGLGKETDLRVMSRGLYPSLSFNRSNSMDGVATWLKSGLTGLCLFYSDQKLDATVSSTDTASGNPIYSTITEGGYHRTLSEKEKKSQVRDRDAGIYLSAGGECWKSGISLLYHKLDALPEAGGEPYRYYSSSKNNVWAGWDYLGFYRNLSVFQEIGLGGQGKVAGKGGVTFTPAPMVKSSLLYEVFPGFWNNPHGGGGSYNSPAGPRLGLTFALRIQLNRSQELNFSADHDRYKWLRYTTTAPSDKVQYHISLKTAVSRTGLLECFFKASTDQSDETTMGKTDSVVTLRRYIYGVSCKYLSDNLLTMNLSARVVQNIKAGGVQAAGWLITQNVSCRVFGDKVKINALIAFFETDSYDERIYAWEPDIYRGFSIPAYYGRGYHYSVVLQYRLTRWADCWIKYGSYCYPGQVTLGSGSEAIAGDSRSEISCQVRVVVPGRRR